MSPLGRSLDLSLEEYARLAARRRERLVAEVHVAVALTDAQRSRLVEALSAAYGHAVYLNVVLDPRISGGMTVRVGDELIDGSVATRLAEAQAQARLLSKRETDGQQTCDRADVTTEQT